MNNTQNLQECVRTNLELYFKELGDSNPSNLWEMVNNCVEKPLLEVVMQKANSNQSKAAEMLGITRNTLRKKLITHHLI
ncbi:DNA-binding protein [Advenella faeciporci]|jgi:Fis family transcriptional regulator|uniref:Putative Fis-like DNA-binding protein n=2 Tax=Advenella TaxID=290425 RepID=A0A918N0M0_9BURK|nr:MULTISPECIES: helix-turn-helix domain-containing protein [Advenella]MBV4397898.1 Fis family transcriptional regulator [Advenella alkanexedens]MDD3756847.1 helix-turn-helix domain-containing protein [Advenella sp.]NLN68478.1 Fis family transcriptional regulator [Alcaligenaceae bacterium]GGW90457.1 DNA-binding protein [Advenella faeciporci]